ncbi:hypothetical protein Pan44_45590 [Caulifigura coniformis]|uniref:Uncharacterized protein n=1 Tax=Caulifigura coniformis TaxID=2527983 RepID=A0A517SK51_9PLAN|nr:hypothetical protein [Caulifigura coniformis]QDT56504.1 hypothetical protein Pan44_45590 [Caulifigura coniformis]
MRLTLRTLLAYLDDILEPTQTREIGARIKENEVVSAIVARIRAVTRRRRIGSPELSGPGSSPDPNVVAEYLDNTLDPAGVADLERVCLDSDMHLAEVAACHQILTIVLGEPVTIRPELRERMYAMGAVSPTPEVGSTTAPVPYAVGSATRPVVPEYLKRPPLWKKLAPLSLAGLVAAGWLYLVATGGFFGDDDQKVAVNEPAPKSRVEPAAPKAKPAAAPAVAPPMIAAAPMQPELLEPEPLIDETPIVPQPEPVAADTAVAATGAAATIPTPPMPGITAPANPPAATEETPGLPEPTVMYTSTEGVLLHRPKGRPTWTVLPRRAILHVGDEVASPEPFIGDLQVSSPTDPALSLRVSLQGGARIRLLPATELMLAEIEINRGRVAVFRGVDGIPHALGLGVTVAGQRTEFDAASPQTRYGLWVELPRATPTPPAVEQWPVPSGTLFVATGTVNVRRNNLPPLSGEPTTQSLEWTDQSADSFAALTTVPTWLNPDIRPLTSQKNWARMYEDEFKLDLPVDDGIGPVAEQQKLNTIATFATRTMALIDNVPVLVRVLTSPHEDTRHAAIVGLREWVMMSPDHIPRLEEEVNRVFRDQEAPIVVKLLWGVTDQEARDEAASLQVVEWLANDDIAIRELAFYEVLRLANRDLSYRPQNAVGQREPAIMRWRDLVRRNKGLVPSAPPAILTDPATEPAPEPATEPAPPASAPAPQP